MPRHFKRPVPSCIVKRSIVVAGHKTSVSLEDAFWKTFRAIARRRERTLAQLAAEIDLARNGNMSSSIRLFVLADLQAQLADAPADAAATAEAA